MKKLGLIFSLWALLALRAHEILRLPAFVDESLHIMRAQIVFEYSDAVSSILPGKLLTYYYLGAFFPENHNALWLGRVAIALLAPLSAALCYALVYRYSRSYWLSLGVVWLYALNPLMLFFERMALADPLALVFSLGFLWALGQSQARPWAILSGVLLGGALLAKLTTLPLVALPLMAYVYGRWAGRNVSLPYLIYLAAGLCLLPSLTYSVYQEVRGGEEKAEIVSTSLIQSEGRSRPEQVADNLSTYS
jgi:dolichyl-phosphate-mannose--protein O-mannosyl transferase